MLAGLFPASHWVAESFSEMAQKFNLAQVLAPMK